MSPDTPRYPLGVTGTPHREPVLRCAGALVRPLSSMALYQRLSVAPLVWSQDMGLPHPILLPLASSVTMGLWSLIFLSSEMRLIRFVAQGQPDSSSAGSFPKLYKVFMKPSQQPPLWTSLPGPAAALSLFHLHGLGLGTWFPPQTHEMLLSLFIAKGPCRFSLPRLQPWEMSVSPTFPTPPANPFILPPKGLWL